MAESAKGEEKKGISGCKLIKHTQLCCFKPVCFRTDPEELAYYSQISQFHNNRVTKLAENASRYMFTGMSWHCGGRILTTTMGVNQSSLTQHIVSSARTACPEYTQEAVSQARGTQMKKEVYVNQH
jgi:hypothetical protein